MFMLTINDLSFQDRLALEKSREGDDEVSIHEMVEDQELVEWVMNALRGERREAK